MRLPMPTLTTDRLTLRPTEAADLHTLPGGSPEGCLGDRSPWIGLPGVSFDASGTAEPGVCLAVERATGDVIGWCSFEGWSEGARIVSLRHGFGEVLWHDGSAVEATAALAGWSFDHAEVGRIRVVCDSRDSARARGLEQLGFVREATVRDGVTVDGEVRDGWVYGLLRRDWRG